MRRAICFDLDGTLLDTIDDLADSMNLVLAARGLPPHPVAPYKVFVGEGIEQLVRRALPEALAGDQTVVAACVEEMRAAYSERWDKKTQTYPGIDALLDTLSARGIVCCVLSNKPDDLTRVIVERLLGRWTFGRVVGAREGVPKKPDPTALRTLVAALAIPAEDWLYVGDTNTDMRTARAAELTSVGVLWGFRGRDELAAAGAEHIIDSPAELLPLLEL